MVRMFSISNIAGALGDEGQNRRTLSLMSRDLHLENMRGLFGCGASPSLPQASPSELISLVNSPGAITKNPSAGQSVGSMAFILYFLGQLFALFCVFVVGLWLGRRSERSRECNEVQYLRI